ncbi:MAG TPA: quinone oxidoreductase [Gaiellaceae bacterium]
MRDVADPEPAANELLVDIEAIGVNYRDVYERERDDYGTAPPAIIGAEAGGIAADARRLVWSRIPGSYAERVAVDPAKAFEIPDGVDTETAVAACMQGMTAHYLAHDSYPIQPGDRVLVHAAAGGVGNLLVQIAKLRGAYVIATASTDEKRELAKDAGADEVRGYDEIEDANVIAVYDGVGRTTFAAGLDALAPTGRMILYGAASGEPDPIDARVLSAKGSLYVQRPTLANYSTPQRAAAVFALIRAGDLAIRIGARYPLSDARRAHEDLEARRTVGKLLLVP